MAYSQPPKGASCEIIFSPAPSHLEALYAVDRFSTPLEVRLDRGLPCEQCLPVCSCAMCTRPSFPCFPARQDYCEGQSFLSFPPVVQQDPFSTETLQIVNGS